MTAQTFEIVRKDEAGRSVRWRVQINKQLGTIACWNLESGIGGTISIEELFSACVLKSAGGGE